MKKEYKKPLVAVEHFSIVYTTARDCMDSIPKDQVTLSDISSCVWDLGGGSIVFTPGVTSTQPCNIDGDLFGVCYNNPGEGHYMFRS